MEGYRTDPTPIKNLLAFALSPLVARHRKHLVEENNRALSAIKEWVRTFTDRLRRTWHHNPNHDQGQHSKERYERERRLAGNLKLIEQTSRFAKGVTLPLPYQRAWMEVRRELDRLLNFGDWWKPRTYVDRATGEVKETLYLPEDTWGAANQLDWMVGFLSRLLRSVRRTTEPATTPYRPREAATSSERRKEASKDWNHAAEAARLREKYGGAQPALPAMG